MLHRTYFNRQGKKELGWQPPPCCRPDRAVWDLPRIPRLGALEHSLSSSGKKELGWQPSPRSGPGGDVRDLPRIPRLGALEHIYHTAGYNSQIRRLRHVS